jgi:membrane associated rhomboid family serine protease
MPQVPDLFVVCKKCGNEVSPYVTECPYCGNRLRKRAPKIEREGGVLAPPRPRFRAPGRLSRLRPGEIPGIRGDFFAKPRMTIALVTLSLFGYLLLAIVARADVGVAGKLHGEWWRVASSPFLYDNIWYELATVAAIAVFGWLIERRHGPLVVLVLFVVCGMGGVALDAVLDPTPLALGGNGAALGLLAAWAVPDVIAARRGLEVEADMIGVFVWAAVLLLMPVAVTDASAIAGLAGGLLGIVAGLALTRRAHVG